jgi:SAM-dependent methyltransferase
MRDAVAATYEDLAGEYYDADRHPTCANFREASGLLTDAWLLADAKHARTFCEVGCGKSLMAETLQRGSMFDRLTLIDSSHSMLGYSEPWRQHRTDLVLADVARLPLRSDTIDALLSSPGDAYNTEGLWAEVARVLALDGVALFTTPSFAWAQEFRRDSADQMVAEVRGCGWSDHACAIADQITARPAPPHRGTGPRRQERNSRSDRGASAHCGLTQARHATRISPEHRHGIRGHPVIGHERVRPPPGGGPLDAAAFGVATFTCGNKIRRPDVLPGRCWMGCSGGRGSCSAVDAG